MSLMFFIKDQRAMSGTCSFNEAASKFGDALVMELMTDHNLITYDGKRPLGIKWSDIAEQVFDPDPKMMEWFAPAGFRGRINPKQIASLSHCDSRLSDVEELLDTGFTSTSIPSEEEASAVKVGQAVKLHSNGSFFWACIESVDKNAMTSKIVIYSARVVDDHMEAHGIKKNEVLSFCPAHIFDVLD